MMICPGGGQNPTIVDSDRGMIMTDVPYGSYDNVDPDNIKQPRLDAAVGRVFADKPSQLIEIINAYCTPISLHNAAIFQLDADTVDWPVQVQVTLMPVLTKYFSSQGNIADSPNFAMDKVYLYDPTNCPGGWTATDVTTALQSLSLPIRVGSTLLSKLPSPSWPLSLRPQAQRLPSSLMAILWVSPAAMATQSL
jgi:hypothetical protein